MNISDKFYSIILPNFRMFQQHVMKKDQNYGCIIGWCDHISAISENSLF